MFDSRSNHPRNRGNRRDRYIGEEPFTSTLPKRQDIDEQLVVLALNAQHERAKTLTWHDIDHYHAQALIEDARREQEREELEAHTTYVLYGGYEPVASWEWALLTGQDQDSVEYLNYLDEFEQQKCEAELAFETEESYYEAEDQPNMNTHDDCWLPYRTIEGCRETYGGTDFIILHTNVLRRTA